MSGPDTFWLDLTNIGLGLVTAGCVIVTAWGVGREIMHRLKRRTETGDDHAFSTPDLGMTMADGGERNDGRRMPEKGRRWR